MKALLILLSLLAVSLEAEAQNWFRTAGPVEDDVLDLCIDSNGILYAVTPLGVNRSTDGGKEWTRPFLFPRTDTKSRMTIAPNGNVIVSVSSGVFVSDNGGISFIQRYIDQPASRSVRQFATSTTGRIFAAHPSGLYYSDKNGSLWESAFVDEMLDNDRVPRAIAASHDTVITHNTTHVYSSLSNNVWSLHKGIQEGGSQVQKLLTLPNGLWVCVSQERMTYYDMLTDKWYSIAGIPDTIIYTADEMRNGLIFLSSSRGIHQLKDTGVWIDVTWGLERNDESMYYPITRFIEDRKNNIYYAATLGSGVWKSAAVLQSAGDAQPSARFTVAPNPFIDRTTIHFAEANPSWSELELRNILGVVVWKSERQHLISGTLPVEVSGIPPGNYLLVLRTNERTETQWVTIVQ